MTQSKQRHRRPVIGQQATIILLHAHLLQGTWTKWPQTPDQPSLPNQRYNDGRQARLSLLHFHSSALSV